MTELDGYVIRADKHHVWYKVILSVNHLNLVVAGYEGSAEVLGVWTNIGDCWIVMDGDAAHSSSLFHHRQRPLVVPIYP